MDNYERSMLRAQEAFLQWDMTQTLGRCGLRLTERALFMRFLGQNFRIDRSSGCVTNLDQERPAGFEESFSIYDYLCRHEKPAAPTGVLKPASGLSYAPPATPEASKLHLKSALYFNAHMPQLEQAVGSLMLAPFPQGDVACRFHVFDSFYAVFQFYAGDEEFLPGVRFLWDECTPSYLKFETLHYVMSAFLRRLRERIE